MYPVKYTQKPSFVLWEGCIDSVYMHIHVADNRGLISLREYAVFLPLSYSHIPNVNGADQYTYTVVLICSSHTQTLI